MQLKKLQLSDGFYKWVDKINHIVDDVDGKFKIETDEIGQTTVLDIAGGTVKIGVADYISVEPATVSLPFVSQSVIGVDLTDNTIKSFLYGNTPNIKFLAIYFVTTNTVGVSSIQDMRTWATNLDAITNELLDEIGDQFLGNFASDPTVDRDGDPLITGAVYYNTTENVLKFYNGTSWFSPQKIATNAANSATQSASEALTSEQNAAASESNAAISETNAADSATAAENAKDEAVSAKDDAVSAKNQAESLFNQFGDQYLGSKPSDPTVDNSGNPLDIGDVYWNSTTSVLKFYSGSAWVAPENIATTAASEAQSSASAASISESNAANSASEAANSAIEAATSESNAATSETNTSNLYDLFDDRFLGAKASNPTTDNDGDPLEIGTIYYNTTTNDVRFYTPAGWISPQTIATSAADNASNSASAASTSASNAATSETNASNSASAASTSASNAATSASSAATSASNAATSETNAANSASSAATSETNAANSASAASTSASNAATSETNAANSASGALTSEQNAATSESNAATSELNAANSEDKAFLWAEEDQNVEVEPGQYSAKHWASVARSETVGYLSYKGNFNASLGVYPSNPALGDLYKVTTAGTVGGRDLAVGEFIFYNGGNPTLTSGWNHIKDTKFDAGTGITLSGTTFSLTGDSFNKSGTYSGLRAQATTKADVGLSNVPNVDMRNASNLTSGTVPIARISSTASRTSSSTSTLLEAKSMNDHRTSGDHDDRYYTKTQSHGQFWRIGANTGYAPTDKDLNDYNRGEGGYLRGSEPNSPPGNSTALNVQTLPGYGSNDNLQLAFPGRDNNRFLMRVGQSGGWNPWIEFWHSGNSDSFNSSGNYANLRARGTTKGDVGLGSVRNVASYSQTEADAKFLSSSENVSTITTNTTASVSTFYHITSVLTLTLPSSPTIGDWIKVSNFSSGEPIIARNGSNIMGLAENMTLDVANVAFTLTYVNTTQGWIIN